MYKTQAETRAVFQRVSAAGGEVYALRHRDRAALHVAGWPSKRRRARNIAIAAQNVHGKPEGAFTGEISTGMLVNVGCAGVIIGHSERRQYFERDGRCGAGENEGRAGRAGLTPIVCVGEVLSERESNHTEAVLRRQFEGGLGSLTPRSSRVF